MNSPEVINLIGEEDSCTDCIKSLDLTNKYYIRRENGDIMSVYEAKIQKRKDVPLNYRFPEMPGLKNNNVITRGGGPSACLSESVLRQVEWDIYAGAKDGMLATATPDTMTQIQHFYRPIGWKTYEMKDWLGTPRLTFSDIKQPDALNIPYANYTYHLDYLSATTTYPFGARIDSLSFEKPSFRFGFTGHLKDNNIRPDKGDGANYSTLFREYDPIIGRWWSIDPLRAKYAGMSPYNYAAGNPINIFDPNGDVNIFFNGQHFGSGGKKEYWEGVDDDIMEWNGDHNAIYFDGSIGGFENTFLGGIFQLFTGYKTCNLDIKARENYGRYLARKHGTRILEDLEKGESIKIFTHSMGSAPAKTFFDELRKNPLYKEKNVVTEYEVDMAAYEPELQYAREGIRTIQRSHFKDKVANMKGNNGRIKGADAKYTRPFGNLGWLGEHKITSFKDEIKDVVPKSKMNPTGTPYIWEENGEKMK